MMNKKRVQLGILIISFLVICFIGMVKQQVKAEGGNTAVLKLTVNPALTPASATVSHAWLEAAPTATVGQHVIVRLMAEGVPALAGFEVVLHHDSEQLGLWTAQTHPAFSGERDPLSFDYIRQTDSVLLAAASCPVRDCASTAYETLPLPSTLSDDTSPRELATFEFTVRQSGELSVHLAEILLVDDAGRFLLTSPQFEADTLPTSVPTLDALDLSGNGVINSGDAYLQIDVWRELRRNGRCLHPNISAYDVNNSGCLTVADVQTTLAAWGRSVSPPPASPGGGHALNTILMVNSDNDGGDNNPGDGQCQTSGGGCTLRAAIEEANALPGSDTIHFDIRDGNGSCPNLVTISPSSGFTVDAADGAGLIIDGYSQCGTFPNSNWINGNAVIKIEIEGNNDEFVFGLHVLSPDNVIKGLALYNWHRQIQLLGMNAHDNIIAGNFLGTNAANTFTQNVSGIEGEGIRLSLGANNNVVGGTTAAARNIVAGNDQDGIGLQGDGVENNVVINNYVGLNQNGTQRLRNGADGVDVAEGAAYNQIGGLNPGERNVISGNNRDGVELSHNPDNVGNHVMGNFIGLRPSGDDALYNGARGVTLEDQVAQNFIYRNVIAGNAGDGVRFYTVFDNQLYDNFIGVVPTGLGPRAVIVPVPGTEEDLLALPNGALPERESGLSGVYMTGGSRYNSVSQNIIAYHPEHGILLDTTAGYLSYGNCETRRNTFSHNSLFANESKGIKLRSGECDDGEMHYPNEGIDPPEIISATTILVMGEACADCLVQLFQTDKMALNDPNGDNWGEGQIYLAEGIADSGGYFAIDVTAVAEDDILTAHATDGNGNTSEFAHNVQAVYVPPPVYRLYLSFVRQDH